MHMCVCVWMYACVYLSLSLVRYVLLHVLSLLLTLMRSARTLANEFDIERGTYIHTETTQNKGCSVYVLSEG